MDFEKILEKLKKLIRKIRKLFRPIIKLYLKMISMNNILGYFIQAITIYFIVIFLFFIFQLIKYYRFIYG